MKLNNTRTRLVTDVGAGDYVNRLALMNIASNSAAGSPATLRNWEVPRPRTAGSTECTTSTFTRRLKTSNLS